MNRIKQPKAPKPPRQLMPPEEVVNWLFEHHPELAVDAEIERSWVWVTADLRGDQNKATRDSINLFGFRFAKRGHVLPSGRIAHWGHAGNHPIPFRRRDRNRSGIDLDSEIDKLLEAAGV